MSLAKILNMAMASLLGYVAQVAGPSKELDAILSITLDKLFRLPNARVPVRLFDHLKALGFSSQLTAIKTMQKAAMAKTFVRSEPLVRAPLVTNGDK